MKKVILSLTLVALVATVFTGCKDDPEPINPKPPKPPVNTGKVELKGDITKAKTLDASKEYDLTGKLVVQDGGSLTIPAGTVIKASGGTSSYIAVAQGGKIFVKGTKDKPVVMTSSNSNPKTGDWGGLVICGKAPTNKGTTATAEVSDLKYGGDKKDDNSGSIKYLRVEYTGATYSPEKEFNGVSLFGVGSGTTLDYIQSYKGGDDGFEFFGGTVSAMHIVSTDSDDDSFDFADGWQGKGDYIYISGGAKAGIEGSNNGEDGDATPKTMAELNHISIVSPRGADNKGDEGVFYIKEGSGEWTIKNVYTSGYKLGFHIKSQAKDPASYKNIKDGKISINPIQFGVAIAKKSEYTGTEKFFTEGDNTGAGAGAAVPDWAKGWTKGLE